MKDQDFIGRVLIVHVDYRDGETRISKPDGLYEDAYWVKHDEEGAVVHVNRLEGENGFPVAMCFVSNLPITAIGFAELGCVPKCTVKGCCGGCFYLREDIGPRPRRETPMILNYGHTPKGGYHFKVWLWKEDGLDHEIAIDPQIYNQGDTEFPGNGPGIARRLLRRLCAKIMGSRF
jgi:hypothetical protein